MTDPSNFRRQNDNERLGRVENDVTWLKDIVGRAADDITELKVSIANIASAAQSSAKAAEHASEIASIMARDLADIKQTIAAQNGGNAMLKYMWHVASVIAGAAAGFLGAGIKHGG